ncbi:MAG: hypothetical protein WCW03_01845 [Candidatus Paceibacterota bacterium]
MFKNRKNLFISLATVIFVFVGLITFAIPVNGQASNLITSFNQGSSYPYDAPNGTKTLTTSGNNISSAIESRANVGGARSNWISLTAGKPYTLTYTYTLNPTNPAGTAPNIRFVSDTSGRGNIYLASGAVRILDHLARSGTNSVVFTPLTTGGYIEISVTNGAKTNFKMENVSVVVTPLPTVTISASSTSVTSGSTSNITWTSTNATSCSVTKAGSAWQTGTSGTNISSGALTTNTTFTATCTGAGGASLPTSATVNVTAPPVVHSTTFNLTVTAPVPPPSYNLTITKTCTSVVLNWSAIPGATSYKVTRFISSESNPSLTVKDIIGTTYTDTTAAINSLWTYSVKANNTATSSPRSIDNTKDPSCYSPTVNIEADPKVSPDGQTSYSSEVSWTSENVTSCDLSTVGGEKGDDWSGYVGSVPLIDTISGTVIENMTFVIDCKGPSGRASDSVSVTVTDDNNGGGGITGTCTISPRTATIITGTEVIVNPIVTNLQGGTAPYHYSPFNLSAGSYLDLLLSVTDSSNPVKQVNLSCGPIVVTGPSTGGSTKPLLWFSDMAKPINNESTQTKTVREGVDVVVLYDTKSRFCSGFYNEYPIQYLKSQDWLDVEVDDEGSYVFRDLIKGKYIVKLKCDPSITKAKSSLIASVISSISQIFAQITTIDSNTITINVVKPTIEEI